MATLTVWKFPTPAGADSALSRLESLQKQELIEVHDGAVVSWPADKKKPRTHQMTSTAGSGALAGSFWGLLFGLIFFVPFVGLAVGAAAGALGGALTDVGIDDDFIKQVREQVTPGTSALFVLRPGRSPTRSRTRSQATRWNCCTPTSRTSRTRSCAKRSPITEPPGLDRAASVHPSSDPTRPSRRPGTSRWITPVV